MLAHFGHFDNYYSNLNRTMTVKEACPCPQPEFCKLVTAAGGAETLALLNDGP
jgi:hypothetical protein